MVDRLSPLEPVYRPGIHGNSKNEVGVTLSETGPGSILQLAAWPGQQDALARIIGTVTGLTLTAEPGDGAAGDGRYAFGIAPGKFTVVDEAEDFAKAFSGKLPVETGTLTDLSHGRTALRIAGPKAEWVLAKLFALDFSPAAFPLNAGRSTMHHDVLAQIQRTGQDRFDLYIFRSFARSFWKTLCHASEEAGYAVE
jgi:methylglutamate dehydrogenase subunit D